MISTHKWLLRFVSHGEGVGELFVIMEQGFGLQDVCALFKIYGEGLLEKQALREKLEWLSAKKDESSSSSLSSLSSSYFLGLFAFILIE